MTQERDNALSISPLAREPAPDDPNPRLLERRPAGGVGLPPADVAPPGRDSFLSRCLDGVFLNRDSLILPEPPPFAPRAICVSLIGERSPLLLLVLLAPLPLLELERPFLEVDKLGLPFLLLLRESEEDVVPITRTGLIG